MLLTAFPTMGAFWSQRETSAVVQELPWFHFKSFSSSITSSPGQYSRSPVVFSLCEWSPAGEIESKQNRIALFADDSKCSIVIESLQDCKSLQKDLDGLHRWSVNWHLKFNTSKCEVLTVTRKHLPFRYDYKLSNSLFKHVSEVKDLGVTISSDITWDTHINSIFAKANRMLAFL